MSDIDFGGHEFEICLDHNTKGLTYYTCKMCKIIIVKGGTRDELYISYFDTRNYNGIDGHLIFKLTCSEIIIKNILE